MLAARLLVTPDGSNGLALELVDKMISVAHTLLGLC